VAEEKTETGQAAPEPSERLVAARIKFGPFIRANPASSIEEAKEPGGHIRIEKPWGDSSVAIIIPDEDDALAAALNSVILPERLVAIWHSEEESLEVIWTALRLSKSWRELDARQFDYTFKKTTHKCHFGPSSEKLIEIARHTLPQEQSETNHRNIYEFYNYATMSEEERKSVGIDLPKSFWISDIKWEESSVIVLLQNLNFFLTYYDDLSPTVVILDPVIEPGNSRRRLRYVHGNVPNAFSSKPLNPNLLGFWSAADTGQPVMRFILYYRIIEYAAFYYLDADVKLGLSQLLSTPQLANDIEGAIERVVEIVSMNKLDDIPRFKSIVRKAVDNKLIWREMTANKQYFSRDIKFDGGFTIKSPLHDTETEENFCSRGLDTMCDTLRDIRNALSHGRDLKTGSVLTPTPRNLDKLRPWVHLIGTAAGEVVIYRHIT